MAIGRIESLKTGQCSLEFRHEPGLVCWLALDCGETHNLLGTEGFGVLLKRLLAFLKGTSDVKAVRHNDGFEWKWVMSTGIPYHFFFGRKDERDNTVIKIWDGVNDREVVQLLLTPQESADWAAQLGAWLHEVETVGDRAFGY